MLNQARKSAKDTDKSRFIEDAGMAYTEIYAERISNLSTQSAPITVSDVVERLIDGYDYGGKITTKLSGDVSGITVKATDVEVVAGSSRTVTVEPTTIDGTVTSYVDIKGEYYPINLSNSKISLGTGLKELPSVSNTFTFDASASTNNVTVTKDIAALTVTITGASKGDSVVTVTYGGKTATIHVTVKDFYTITIQSEDTEKGTVSPNISSQKYIEGEELELSATAKTGYTFKGWYDGDNLISEDNPCTYTVGKDETVTAKFKEAASEGVSSYPMVRVNNGAADIADIVTMDVDVGDSGMTNVTSFRFVRSNGAIVSYKPSSSYFTVDGNSLTLKVNGVIYEAEGWYVVFSDGDNTVEVPINIFVPGTYYCNGSDIKEDILVTIQSEDTNKGIVTPNVILQQYKSGDLIDLNAEAKSGYRFFGWYTENTLISGNINYRFRANYDAVITGKFIGKISVEVKNGAANVGDVVNMDSNIVDGGSVSVKGFRYRRTDTDVLVNLNVNSSNFKVDGNSLTLTAFALIYNADAWWVVFSDVNDDEILVDVDIKTAGIYSEND